MQSANYPVKFLDNIKPEFIGLPKDLALTLANAALKQCGLKSIKPPSHNASAFETMLHLEDIKKFLYCSKFRLINAPEFRYFTGYLAPAEYIEISSIHRAALNDGTPIIDLQANEKVTEAKWLTVKRFIDDSNFEQLIDDCWEQLDRRNKMILFSAHGLGGFIEKTNREIASEAGLSPERVRQIIINFDSQIARMLRKFRRKASALQRFETSRIRYQDYFASPELHPWAKISDWLIELSVLCRDVGVGTAHALQYIEIKWSNKYRELITILPFASSTEALWEYISRDAENTISMELQTIQSILQPIESENKNSKHLHQLEIKSIPFSSRTQAALEEFGIETVGDLIELSQADLRRIPNLGRRSISEILAYFKIF
jgi:Bacterial RNA polymerase, alpha chain C terminal domain